MYLSTSFLGSMYTEYIFSESHAPNYIFLRSYVPKYIIPRAMHVFIISPVSHTSMPFTWDVIIQISVMYFQIYFMPIMNSQLSIDQYIDSQIKYDSTISSPTGFKLFATMRPSSYCLAFASGSNYPLRTHAAQNLDIHIPHVIWTLS